MTLKQFLLTWLSLLIALILGWFYVNIDYYDLARHGIVGSGTVIEVRSRADGRWAKVAYTAGSRSLAEWGYLGANNPAKKDVKAGETVRVYYLPSNPTIRSFSSASADLVNEMIFIGMVALFVLPVVVYGIARSLIFLR